VHDRIEFSLFSFCEGLEAPLPTELRLRSNQFLRQTEAHFTLKTHKDLKHKITRSIKSPTTLNHLKLNIQD